jgi:hypothetical protein
MKRYLPLIACLILSAGLVFWITGCGRTPAPKTAANSSGGPPESPPADGHAHRPGSHGGTIVAIGQDNYHAEAIFEKGGTVKLFILGKDEARIQEVDAQELTAYALPEGGAEATSFVFQPAPQPDDQSGKTSAFVAFLPVDLAGKNVDVTVHIKVAGDRFRFSFTSPFQAHLEPPAGTLSQNDERKLYLTPGGLYTEADIQANGHVTAGEKFKGARAAHDLKPRPGERICPVTLTKANPKITWIVGGKTYEFCCPPCVDEFLQKAKEHPEDIKEPQDYVKK